MWLQNAITRTNDLELSLHMKQATIIFDFNPYKSLFEKNINNKITIVYNVLSSAHQWK